MPAEGNSINEVNAVLNQLHDAGVLNLDKSVREMMAPAGALAELKPGAEVATSVIAWDGYGLVIKGALATQAEIANVSRELRRITGPGG